MSTPADHLAFLKKGDFPVPDAPIFGPAERFFLARFGYWMEALATKAIRPFTQAQVQFVAVCCGEREPQTYQELLWAKLQARKQWEQQQQDAPCYHVSDAGEKWFPRSEHWRNRGGSGLQ